MKKWDFQQQHMGILAVNTGILPLGFQEHDD
jgi:hypothetical protein